MKRLRIATGLGALIVGSMVPATAQPVAPARNGEPVEQVRVYTNADLERLAPRADEVDRTAAIDDSGWEFVTEFLDRQYERMDAERLLDLERRHAVLEEEAHTWLRARPVYSYGYYVYPFTPSCRHERSQCATIAATPSVGGRVVPLHARDTLAQRQRSRAIRRSGSDAIPNRARDSRSD